MTAEIEITAFSWVPEGARGLVRDLRVRWALEEMGEPYRKHLYDRSISGPEDRQPEQPFGQVPAFREGDIAMFESGAICLHLAERSPALLPRDGAAKARALSWAIAALSSVEPYISLVQHVTFFDADKPGAADFVPTAMGRLSDRLHQLEAALGEKDWLDGQFTVADLLMVSVLRPPARRGTLADWPKLAAYVARGEARPAFRRALDAQMADFKTDAEAGA
ncbi:MAG: glutathione S-transferase family protein [Novosphingobium sp.]|nr:glutathione S-transferase family protein [Novosphingobium sp.]